MKGERAHLSHTDIRTFANKAPPFEAVIRVTLRFGLTAPLIQYVRACAYGRQTARRSKLKYRAAQRSL